MRRLDCRVTAQTAYHLNELRKICGYKEIGMVVDKLVREHQMLLKHEEKDHNTRPARP